MKIENDADRCMHPSTCQWNFVRTFYCSLPIGHEGDHVAYWDHDPDYQGIEEPVAWTGPWA